MYLNLCSSKGKAEKAWLRSPERMVLPDEGSQIIREFSTYSLVLNKRTGTMKKNSPKFQAVLNLFCGTIESNSRFWDVVLLFQPLRVPLTSLICKLKCLLTL